MANAQPVSGVNAVVITADDILLFVAAVGGYRRLHPLVPDELSARVLLAYEVAQREGHPRALALLSRVEALADLLQSSHRRHLMDVVAPLDDWTQDGANEDGDTASRTAVFAAAATHPLIWTARGYAFEGESFLARVHVLMREPATPDLYASPDEDGRDRPASA